MSIFLLWLRSNPKHTLFLCFRPGNEKGSKPEQELSKFQCIQRAYLTIMKRNISETITAAFETCNLKGNHHRSAASSCSQGKQSSGMGISWDVQGYTGTAALMGHPQNIAVTANKNCCLMLWPQTVGAGVEWGWGKDACQGQCLPLKASEESCTVHYFWRWQSYSNKIYKRIWERLIQCPAIGV